MNLPAKSITTILLSYAIIAGCYAQTPLSPDSIHYWKKSAVTELAFNQAALTNWQGGGQNTIAASGFLHAFANYDQGRHQWYNKLEAAFGMVRLGNNKQPFIKNDDGLEITSIYARGLGDSVAAKHWGIAAGADFRTTFAP